MSYIVPTLSSLEAASRRFSVEALSTALEPSWVHDALRSTGCASQRVRLLPADFVLWAVLLLFLFRRESYVNLLIKLRESLWARRRWPGAPPTSSAFTQARDRLGVEPVRAVYEVSAGHWMEETPGLLIAGLRLMGMDGSTGRTADSEANRAFFGLPPSSRGRSAYPLMRILTIFDVGSRMTVALRTGPYATGEMTLARSVVDSIPDNALIVMDRNFLAFTFLYDLLQHGTQFIVRVKRNTKVHVVRWLGLNDALVRIRFSGRQRKERPDLPKSMLLRQVIYTPKAGHEEIRVLTSLVNPVQALPEDVAKGYGLRWEHEVGYDEIKTHLAERTTTNRAVLFRSLKPERVQQEAYALFAAHNLVRILMHRAGDTAGISELRLSFVACLERLREAIQAMMILPTQRLLDRYERMLEAMALVVVPLRPGRSNPREVKIKVSSYPCKGSRYAA